MGTCSLLAEAILGCDWIDGKTGIDRNDRIEGRRIASRARLLCGRFPNLRPHSFRVSGRAATANGKPKKALKYFDKAIATAEKIGARYEHARSLIDKSILDHPDAGTDRKRGLQMLEELGCVLPVAEMKYLDLMPDATNGVSAEQQETLNG